MRRVLLGGAIALACGVACGPAPKPKPAPGPAPSAVAPEAPESWPALRKRLLDGWLADEPSWGRQAGLHEHDGRVADYALASIEARAKAYDVALATLGRVDESKLSADDALDRRLLEARARLQRFNLVERRLHRENPAFYGELFEVSRYIDFDYAPLADRAAKLVEHEEAAVKQLDHVLKNLDPVLSKPVVETAIKIFDGHASYLRGDVPKVLAAVKDPALQARFAKANGELAAGAKAIAAALRDDFLPKASADKHVLGRERYLRFVAAQEGRPITLEAFKRMADEDLARNKSAYEALAKTTKTTRPSKETLLSEATRIMDASRTFVVDKKLVTIPSTDRAELRESPPFMRWNAAFLNMPGPYDSARQGYYYITLPDPKWPAKMQEEYIFLHGILMSTTVHEVYPGHFLQGLWTRKAPTRAQKLIDSYSFVEGWAHYAEQLMVEEGFMADDPQNKLGQLSDALLRNCRFVVSIGVHAEGMSLETAAKRFREDCFQDEASAREQAVRATFDPGFFAYTVGKLQILALRDEAKKALGDRFDPRAFHDAVLSHGSPPVALIHQRVLRDLGAKK